MQTYPSLLAFTCENLNVDLDFTFHISSTYCHILFNQNAEICDCK
jgi:hypothetical protein